jgi:hypothetical protein
MVFEGQYSGLEYDLTSYYGAAQYTVDAFEAACQIADEFCYEDIFEMATEKMIDSFCPKFVFHDEGGDLVPEELNQYVEVEIQKMRNRLSGQGGQAVTMADN